MTLGREDSLDRQTENSIRFPGRQFINHRDDRLTQFIDSLFSLCADPHHRCVLEESPLHRVANLLLDQFQHLFIHQINLVDGDDPALNSENRHDRKVFEGLWHH